MAKRSEAARVTPKIDTGIPIPPVKRSPRSKSNGAQISWPMEDMEIGDSILVPDWAEPSRAIAYVTKAKREKKLPATFKIVVRETPDGFRVWRIA